MRVQPYINIQGDAAHLPLADKSIDLTVTSPPYDNLRSYQGFNFDFEATAKELFRVTKKGGVVVWVVGDATIKGSETGTSFRQALFFKEIGFNLHDTMIYKKTTMPLNHNRYENEFEYMFVLVKGKLKTFNPLQATVLSPFKINTFSKNANSANEIGSKQFNRREKIIVSGVKRIRGNIWRFPCGHNLSSKDRYAFQHPAIFPEQLANDHILSWSNEGDTVLDCFSGSGTTGKMSIINKRKFIGIETSKDYCEISKVRIKRANLEPCDLPKQTNNLKPTPLFDGL